MEISEQLNQFITNEGNGCERDALNIALVRYEALRLNYVQAMKELKEAKETIEKLQDNIEMIGANF